MKGLLTYLHTFKGLHSPVLPVCACVCMCVSSRVASPITFLAYCRCVGEGGKGVAKERYRKRKKGVGPARGNRAAFR